MDHTADAHETLHVDVMLKHYDLYKGRCYIQLCVVFEIVTMLVFASVTTFG